MTQTDEGTTALSTKRKAAGSDRLMEYSLGSNIYETDASLNAPLA